MTYVVAERGGFERTGRFALLTPGKHDTIWAGKFAETVEITHFF